MIEMLGVLAIVGVLSVGGIAGYSKAMEKFKTNQLLNDIAHLVVDVQNISLNQNENKYAWINNSYRQLNNILGVYDAFNLDNYKNIFGGSTHLSIAWDVDIHSENQQYFSISLGGLPLNTCIELLTTDWGASNSGFVGIGAGYGADSMPINDAPCTSDTDYQQYFRCYSKKPLSVAIAAKACEKISNNYYDGVQLTFK